MGGLALLAFALCAIVDWMAVANRRTTVEYIAKPAALAALLVYAAASPAPSVWLLAALVLSLLGDVYLMLPAKLFIAGLSAFLLAHLAYIAELEASAASRLVWLVLVLAASYPLTTRILCAVSDPGTRGAVGLYMSVISLMVASAIASGSWLAVAGALLFFASDGLIAWNRFVAPFAAARTAIIITYHLGQLGLVLALRV